MVAIRRTLVDGVFEAVHDLIASGAGPKYCALTFSPTTFLKDLKG